MGVVFSREFKALFRNLRAVICIAALALVSGIFLITNNISTGYSGIQAVFANMSLAAAITIPPVAAAVITDERKSGKDVLLRALPVTTVDVVLGKFFAVLAFFMIPTAVLATFPVILSLFGAESVSQGYIILAMFIALEMFLISLSMMMSALMKKTWQSIVAVYVILTVLFLVGMLSALTSGVLEQIMRFVSPFRRFDPLVFDMLDLTSALFYLSFAALFIFVTIVGVKKAKAYTDKAKKARMRTAVMAAALAGIILGVNIGAVIVPESSTRIDISNNGIYEISEPTLDYLDSLNDDITIYLINPVAGEERLHAFIRRYCEQSDRITLKEINTSKDTEFLNEKGISYTPSYYSIVVESGKRHTYVDSESFFSYYHPELGFMSPSDYIRDGTYLQQGYYYAQQIKDTNQANSIYEMIVSLAEDSVYCFNPEQPMTEAIEYVLADELPTVYFISGHGEKNTAGSPLDITAITEIPSNAALLIINDPDTDYSATELAMLQKYSDRGGKLMVLTSPDAYGMTGLMAFMQGFGLSVEEGTLSGDDGAPVSAMVNTSADVFSGAGLTSLEMIGGSSIISSQIEGLTHTPLLGVEVTTGEGEEAEKVTKVLAMAVTKNKASKLIWITGADTFNRNVNNLTDAEKTQYTYAAQCIQYSTLWLRTTFTSKLSFPQPKPYNVAMMTVSPGAGAVIGVIFIGLIPFGLVGTYFGLRYTRKKRRKAVKIEE